MDFEKIKNIIDESDPGEAIELLKELKKSNSSLGLPASLILQLKFIAFPSLSDDEASELLQKNYLDAFSFNILFKGLLTAKLFSIPYSVRDELRKKLKRALVENQQKLGLLTVGQWITEFEKTHDVKTRNLSASVDFVNTSRNAMALSPIEKGRLKELINTYDYLLVTTLPATGPALNAILNSNHQSSQNLSSTQSQTLHNFIPQDPILSNLEDQTKIEHLSLSDVLKKFPELGEQLITSMRIKLKNFPEPVRPSINNWLSDYTFSLGFESHSAMDRGTYLFRNDNSKILNSNDRERLSFILKAYDENSLVDVNVNTKQVIFPKRETKINEQKAMNNNQRTTNDERRTINNNQQARINTPQLQVPQRNISEIYNAKKQSDQPKDIFKEERITTENRNAGNINFSSPQKLPYEKQVIQPQPIQQPQKPTPVPQPMRISSQNLRKTDVPPGNIVNLKDKQ